MEKERGKYDWAWVDEIIPDMVAQGVKPWVCLCYGNPIVALWRDSHRPGERPEVERLGLTLPGLQFTQPVWVDLLSGKVYAIAASQWSRSQDAAVFRGVPAYDSVVLIAERKAIPLAPGGK